jgi:hypothetical protein
LKIELQKYNFTLKKHVLHIYALNDTTSKVLHLLLL